VYRTPAGQCVANGCHPRGQRAQDPAELARAADEQGERSCRAQGMRTGATRGAGPRRVAAKPVGLGDLDDGGNCRHSRRGLARFFAVDVNPLARQRKLDIFASLVDAPLHRCERDLERVCDLGVRESDDVAKQQRHLEVDVQRLDGAPDGVDRLEPLERCVEYLERRNVVDVDDRTRAPLDGAKLVEDAVLRTWKSQVVNFERSENAAAPGTRARKISWVKSSARALSPTSATHS